MAERDKRRVRTLDELRQALADCADAAACRRFDQAVAAGERLRAIRIAREYGIAVGDERSADH